MQRPKSLPVRANNREDPLGSWLWGTDGKESPPPREDVEA